MVLAVASLTQGFWTEAEDVFPDPSFSGTGYRLETGPMPSSGGWMGLVVHCREHG